MWSFGVEENLYRFFFIVCLYMHCRWRSTYQETRVRIPLPGIAPSHVCVCTKARPGFPTTVLFVNNGGIDEYQRLKFLFIIQWEKEWTRNNLNEYFKKNNNWKHEMEINLKIWLRKQINKYIYNTISKYYVTERRKWKSSVMYTNMIWLLTNSKSLMGFNISMFILVDEN
jgi:hypothetical protein